MVLVTVKMPDVYVSGLDRLVRMGRYSSRSEAIRVAVRLLLERELWGARQAEASGEVYVAAVVSDWEVRELERIARARGVTLPELLRQALREHLESQGVEA